ncbi:MAG: DNA polymerase III subunit beta [Pirellula sp.]
MKIVTNREKFLAAFQIAAGIAPTRSPKEVLNNIKIEANENRVVLMATDLEAGIRLNVDDVQVLVPGKALLNVQRVGNILREATDESLSFETKDGTLDVQGAHSEFHLPLANPDEFPSVVEFAEESYFELPARLFKELVKRTIFATDNESTRYQLGGVLFEMEGEQITTVATDGRRLASMTGKGQSVGGFKNTGMSTIVPTKTLNLMDRSISDKEDMVHIAARSNDILIRTNRCTIYSRLVEGRYPNWRQVMPSRENKTRIDGMAGPFLAAIRQASIVADPESRGVEFVFGNGTMVVAARTADVGQSRVEMPISYTGDEVKITMDYRFVSDFFKALDLETPFSIDVRSNAEPALFSTEDGYTYVVMPMAKQ